MLILESLKTIQTLLYAGTYLIKTLKYIQSDRIYYCHSHQFKFKLIRISLQFEPKKVFDRCNHSSVPCIFYENISIQIYDCNTIVI